MHFPYVVLDPSSIFSSNPFGSSFLPVSVLSPSGLGLMPATLSGFSSACCSMGSCEGPLEVVEGRGLEDEVVVGVGAVLGVGWATGMETV